MDAAAKEWMLLQRNGCCCKGMDAAAKESLSNAETLGFQ